MKSDLVDIEVVIHHETAKAWLVSDDGEKDKAVWIPKSVGELERGKHGRGTLTLPEQFAIDKGLV